MSSKRVPVFFRTASISWMVLAAFGISASAKAAGPATTSATAAEDTDSGRLEEVVVTAQKRSENSQKLAASITVITGDELEREGLTDARSLVEIVPSLSVGSAGSTPAIFFRGVGQTIGSANTDAGVAVTFNGIEQTRQFVFRSMFDIERVEALPGPQGTLYGTNAIGGIISYVTRLPSDRFEGYVTAEGGNFGLFHGTAAASIPLASDFSARAAIDYTRHDGYFSDGLGDQNSVDGRVTLQYKPDESLRALVYLNIFHESGLGDAYQNHPFFTQSDPWYLPLDAHVVPPRDNNGYSTSAQVDYSFAGMNLSYLPSWTYVHLSYGIPSFDTALHLNEQVHQVTNEIRLSNQDNNRSKWMVGLYQYHNVGSQTLNITLFPSEPNINVNEPVNFDEQIYAGFAQYTYSVLPRLRLTGGGRYSVNEKQGGGASVVTALLPGVSVPVADASLEGFSDRWRRFDWKIGTEWDVSGQSMVYASVSTGFLNGGFASPPIPPTENVVIQPETLTAYTVGIKNRFFDNRLQLNNEVFHYDYKDYQVSAIDIATAITTFANAPRASIWGDQLDAVLALTSSDRLTAGVGYLRARATNFDVGALGDFTGFELPNSPTMTSTVAWDHTWLLGGERSVDGTVRTHYDSGEWLSFNHFAQTHQDAYTRTDLMLAYCTDRKKTFSIGLFVRNVENTASAHFALTNTIPGPASVFLDPPRTYGATLQYRFGD